MYIYLYIDVAMTILALVELLKITLLIIENVKDTSSPILRIKLVSLH